MKNLCIVGSGITMMDTPFNDPDCLVWTTVSVATALPRTDLAFEMHRNRYTAEYLNGFPIKAFMLREANKEVHDSQRLPIERLEEAYGKVFPGSMSMILAWAALSGHKKVTLYGIDMTTDTEYGEQRGLFLYLMGYLRAKGMCIIQSEGSGLNDECATYIQDEVRDIAIARIKTKTVADLRKMEQDCEELQKRIIYTNGFLEAVTIQERSKHHGGYKRV